MTLRQRVLFTALPNGLVEGEPGHYRLSVHVAPRLSTTDVSDTVLSEFPDWADWPAVANAIGWSVAFGNGSAVAATVESAPARSDLWKALFAGGALVRSHNPPDLSQRRVRSYPARNVTDYLREQYTDLAVNSPEEFPHIDALMGGGFGPLTMGSLLDGSTQGPVVWVESELAQAKAFTNGPPLTDVKRDFYQLVRFHRSRTSFAAYEEDDHVPPVVRPTLDFHEVVSSCGQYPPLLRLLGLVVDLVVDLGGTLPASPTDVRVVPSWTPQLPKPAGSTADSVAARTRCLVDGGQFRARPRASDPDLVDGRLPMNDTDRFTLLQVDQDGAALKAVDFATNLARIRFGRSSATPDHYAVPSLRSGGLSVAFSNRAVGFHDRMERGQDKNEAMAGGTPGEVVLDAEDVTRGHRIDIRDTREGRWFSLAARRGTYRFPGGVEVPYEDESWTTTGVTEDDTAQKDLYLQETLFRWGGWSLAAERPGGRIATTQEEDPPVTTAPTAPDPDFPVLVDTRVVPGSLPRLRFGRRYEVRARAVDLAGNSDPLAPTVDDRRRTPPVDYLRFEPVQTPPVLPYARRTEGESLERVVLRSNYNRPPARDVEVARHIVPPKASQVLAEQHGLFDTGFPNSVVDASTYDTITRYVGPKPPPEWTEVVQSEQGSFATSIEAVNDPEDHTKSFYYPVEHVTLPYLPDPLARGAALRFLDHPAVAPGARLEAPFSPVPSWPAHKPVRLVVVEGDGAPSYDPATHRVVVPLRKADVVRVRLSAYLPREDLEKLGIWKWIVDGGGEHLAPKVVDGRHWMVTPYRTLTLVHAVKQPLALAQPNVDGPSGFLFRTEGKQLAETFARFRGTIQYSRRSTGKVDVIGTWKEYVDHGPGSPVAPTAPPAVDPETREEVAFTLPGSRGAGEGIIILGGDDHPEDRHEFNDTKHRRVSYTTVATTKFPEHFVKTQDVQLAFGGGNTMVVEIDAETEGVVPGSVKVKRKVLAQPDGTVEGVETFVEGVHFTVNATEGKVTFRRLNAAGQPNFPLPLPVVTVAYLEPPIVRPGPGESVVPADLSIPSSAPPAAPRPLYAVPTFGWESKKGPVAGHYESRRRGRGLRVYLERPWWSSGEGELLGVVLDHPTANAGESDVRDAVVTRVGVDPVFKSVDELPPLNIFDFPAAKVAGIGQEGQGYQLTGAPGRVLVSGHEVGYDSARKLWY